MKFIRLWHLLLYLFLLQLAVPIPTLAWGEPIGSLVGALIAAVLTPLLALALSRMHRLLLRLGAEKAAHLAFSARGTPTGELFWLPILKVVGAGLARGLGPVSIVLLFVCLSGILPGLLYMLLVCLQLLLLLVILLVAALVMLGQAHPELLRFLVGLLPRRQQRDEQPAAPVIIVTDTTSYEQAPPGIPLLGKDRGTYDEVPPPRHADMR